MSEQEMTAAQKQRERSRYRDMNMSSRARRDRADMVELAQTYISPRRCRDCHHLYHPTYCCWKCGSSNP